MDTDRDAVGNLKSMFTLKSIEDIVGFLFQESLLKLWSGVDGWM